MVVVLIAFLLAPASPAQAAGFHKYATEYETSFTNRCTGIRVTRPDRAVTFGGTNGCGAFYSGNPVYQTQWVMITSNAQNWLELGTGHQCSDTLRYWFWGYGYAGDWYPQGQLTGQAAGVSHDFRIARTGGQNWSYRIDGTDRGSVGWADQGAQVATGLESYAAGATVSQYGNSDLRYGIDEGAFVSWSGYDTSLVNGPEMCGGWNSASWWRASENSSC